MKFKNRPNKSIVYENKEYWISRSPAVFGVVVFKKNDEIKVLACKRGPLCPDHVGMWCLPCGYLDWDESGEEALVREVYEETSLNLNSFKNILLNHLFNKNPFFVNTIPTENNQNVSLGYALVIEIETWPDTSFSNEETEAVALIDINDYQNYEFAFNHEKRIKEFLDHLKANKII